MDSSAESHPDLDPERESIQKLLSLDRRVASDFTISKNIQSPSRQWDLFYKSHQQNFFKDRHWTDKEFSVLSVGERDSVQDSLNRTSSTIDSPVLLECGCGVGNLCFPLLEKDPNLKVHCFDFSPRAINLVKSHPNYDPTRINAFVYDLTTFPTTLPSIISTSLISTSSTTTNSTPTLISLIFVLSAIEPSLHFKVLKTLVSLLPSGGSILFRDYAYGDLSQLRFHSNFKESKKEIWHESNLLDRNKHWYKRGDGTLTYFFEKLELENFAKELDLEGEVKIVEKVKENRKLGLEMKRKWIQVEWKKN